MYHPPGSYYGYGAGPPRPLPYEPAPPSETPASSARQSLPPTDEVAATALLKHLDKQELQGLLDDESKLQDLVDDLSQVRNIQMERETLLAFNKSAAEHNLTYQPQLEKLKGEVASGHEEVRRLQGVLEEDRAQLLLRSNDQSLDMLLALLQTECAKTEEESEQLAENFCDKKLEVDRFVEEFMQSRTLAHLRRIKCDKMAELMVSQPPVPPPRTQPSKGWFNNNSSSSSSNVPTSLGAPYPANNLYMMMPEPFTRP
ncbi:vacuolar protein sorting-associated protein 37B-like [Liolophura sinensis]|uniref:vacuolar protein sorting-associated protein 37B-like n=1 Tax=Liolophura sinensis TaxID=3198878 RepID=UPI0031598B79